MSVIGILPATRLGRLSQLFCLQKMKDAGVDTTIVYTSYFDRGVKCDAKVSSESSLERLLSRYGKNDLVVISNESRSYKDVIGAVVPPEGFANVFTHGYGKPVPATKELVRRSLSGSSVIAASVESILSALSDDGEYVMQHASLGEVVDSVGSVPVKRIGEVADKIPVVVSISTYRLRFPILDRSIGSVLAQSVKPYKVCVTVDSDDVESISGYLKTIIDNGDVELLVGDRSLGPHNKYLHAMRKYQDMPVVTFDDDMVYRKDALKRLWETHLRYPDCVCSRRAHLIKWNADGTPKRYLEWENQCVSVRKPSFDLFATGVGGVLYPASVFSWSDDDVDIMRSMRNDDIFLKHRENMLGIRVVTTGDAKDADIRIRDHNAQENALLITNVNNGGNDREIKGIGLSRPVRSSVDDVGDVPFFRVIIPVYKSSRTLKRAIASIASQTFDDYVVSVCDDGSPEPEAEENRRTVESLGDKAVFSRHDRNYFAGKARNTAMSAVPRSEYTLFLDADDRFSYPALFRDLHDFILYNGFPDVVALPANRRDQGSSLDFTMKHAVSVELYASDRRFETPWSKCIRTSKVKPFQEGLRRCNDVLQHWRVVDDIESVLPFNKIAVDYMSDSETTMFGNTASGVRNRQTIPALTGYLKCAEALLETKWKHRYVSVQAAKEAKTIIMRFMPNLIQYGGLSNLESVKEEFDREN